MRIQTRLLLLTTFWGVALAITLGSLIYLARTIPTALQSAAQVSIREQAAARQMRAELRDSEAALYRYLMEGEQGFAAQFEAHLQAFEENLTAYAELATGEDEQAWVQGLWSNDATARQIGRSLIALRDQQGADLQALQAAQSQAMALLSGPIPAARSQDLSYQKAVGDMRISLQDMLLAVTAYLNTPRSEERSHFSEATVRYMQAQQRFRALAQTAQERSWDRELSDSFGRMRGISLRLINARDQQLEEFAQFAAILFHMGQELLVESIQPAAEQNFNQTWLHLLSTVRFVVIFSLLSSVAVFVAATALTVPMIRQLNSGISVLLAGADRVAVGELSQPVPLRGGYELQRLGRTFNSMMAELAQRERRLKRRLSELEALREVSLQLTSTLEPDRLFNTIAQVALRLVSADEVHIFRSEGQPTQLSFVASAWGSADHPAQPRPPRPNGLVMQTARTGEPVVLNHARQHPLFTDAVATTWEVQAAAGFPLRVGAKVVGVLSVSVRDRQEFSEGDLRILGLLADQAAVAIENMHLYSAVAEREARLQTVLRKLAHVQEEERRLVGLDLHDGLTQLLISANMHLNALEAMADAWDTPARQELQRGHARLRAAIDEARRVIAELRPAALEDLGLVDGLRQYVATMAQQENWQLEFVTDLPDSLQIPPQLEIALFRIAQEALANTRKYARTPRVRLRLSLQDHALTLEIRDWGRGFAPDDLAGEEMRLGLLGMQERAAMFDGTLLLKSEPGAGVQIVVRIPYPVSNKVVYDVPS